MLFFGKKKMFKPLANTVYATQNGTVLSIEEMPDPIFAEKVLGDGVCILPVDGKVYCPISGTVENIADACHAFGIVGEDGADVMVHIGVDTVEMKGRGFKAKVRAGQKVLAGDVLCTVDLAMIQEAGYAVHTAVLLTNGDEFEMVESYPGPVMGGESPVFCYKKRD